MANESYVLTAPVLNGHRRLSHEAVVRLGLCAFGVGICYCFGWHWLRAWTCAANVWLDRWVGLRWERVGPEVVVWRGHVYFYAIACSFADVWCGALALVWDLRKSVRRNFVETAGFTGTLLAFNIARLTLSDLIVAAGAPWWLGHSVVAGFAYFAVWMWIARDGGALFPARASEGF
jgi:hypothetical protein